MKRVVLGFAVCCCLGGFAGSASAAMVTFDFNNGLDSGNQLTVGGYTLQVQAWTAQQNTGNQPWGTTGLGSAAGTSEVTHSLNSGLGVSNTIAGTDEIDTNLYSGMLGYQDWLSFKLLNPPASPVARYVSVTYSGLDTNERSQARISTAPNGILGGGANPLGTTNTTDQWGLVANYETITLPTNFTNGNWYLLVGPRLGDNGAGDSFRVAAVTMDIAPVPVPGAAWLLGSGLLGLAGLGRRKKTAVA